MAQQELQSLRLVVILPSSRSPALTLRPCYSVNLSFAHVYPVQAVHRVEKVGIQNLLHSQQMHANRVDLQGSSCSTSALNVVVDQLADLHGNREVISGP